MAKRSKLENAFIMSSLFICGIGVLCITGCGEQSCETVQCGSYEEEGLSIKGISIPGCGGCFSSGSGCDCAVWSQSIKISFGTIEQENDGSNAEKVKILGCDDKFYGKKDIFGCDTSEKSAYSGIYLGGCDNSGCFFGGTDSEEKNIGCIEGEWGCGTIDEKGNSYVLDLFEIYEGIE